MSHSAIQAWSQDVQGIAALDSSRAARFRDDRRDEVLRALRLEPGMSVVDAGCGPGTLTRKVARWLGGGSRVVGVDIDAAFVRHGRVRAMAEAEHSVSFIRGDVLALPLKDASVDACFSHTVIEHVPNAPFLREQKRVCRRGGPVSVMSVRPESGLSSMPESPYGVSERERELWEPIDKALKAEDERRGVGSFWPAPSELPSLFERLGFRDIRLDALALPVAPDDARLTAGERSGLIDGYRAEALERLALGARVSDVGAPHVTELKALIESRFEARLDAVAKDTHLWDFQVSVVLVASGCA